jgi:hypothetical protein
MPRAAGGTAVCPRIIDRHFSRAGIESVSELVMRVMVGRPDTSDHSERLEG